MHVSIFLYFYVYIEKFIIITLYLGLSQGFWIWCRTFVTDRIHNTTIESITQPLLSVLTCLPIELTGYEFDLYLQPTVYVSVNKKIHTYVCTYTLI